MTYPTLHGNNTHNSSAPILVLFIAGGKDINLIGYRGCLTTPFRALLKIDQGKPLNQTQIPMNVNSQKRRLPDFAQGDESSNDGGAEVSGRFSGGFWGHLAMKMRNILYLRID